MADAPIISYWRKGLKHQNFGDLLSELLLRELSGRSLLHPQWGRPRSRLDVLHLIGSVISDYHVKAGLEHSQGGANAKVAFWCCGKKDALPLDPELLEHCVFFGVRGPLTRDALGLPPDTPMGDPALLLPALYSPRPATEFSGASLCVPHFLEKKTDEQLLSSTGAQAVVRPNIEASLDAIHQFIDKITSARFVLCGALHAAIVCCAYRVPYSYFDSGFIDVPFKWRDFAASIGIEADFARTLPEGEQLHAKLFSGIRKPDLAQILACAPITPPDRLKKKVHRYLRAESA